MSKEMVISANRHETRVALLEDDQLVEVHFQRANEYSLAASIHKGRVTRVLPGMQSAFVDLGLERDTFLYVSDFLEESGEDIDRVSPEDRPRDRGRDRDRRPQPGARPPQPSVGEGEPAPGEAAEAAGAGPAPSAGAPLRDQERGEQGDRRGRRSRRRRHRGRGFPESKYADASSAAAPESAATPEPEAEAEPAPSEESTPLVLPGESLRKYRGAPGSAAAAGASELEEPVEEPKAPDAAEGETQAATGVEENEYDEPIHYPPENAVPDAPVHHLAAAEAPAVLATPGVDAAPAPPSELVEPPAPPIERHAAEAALEDQAQEHEADSGAGPIVAPGLDEDEDSDIQAMILGEVEGLEDRDGEIGAVAAPEIPAPETAAAQPGVEAAPAAEAESGTAEVRERGGRYPHRLSRRMRRRGRGGAATEQRGESRGETRVDGREATPAESKEGAAPPRPQERTVSRPSGGNQGQPSISDLLKEGQEIIVQIAKEPLGQKGARITSHIALPGRYVVYMPTLEHIGVSRKIASDEERLRLKRILQGRRPGPGGGFITRTAAEGRTEEEIGADMEFLYQLWQDIKAKAERKPAPLLLHHDLDIVQRVLRDQLTDSFKAIWIDNEDLYENVVSFVQRFQPALVGRVKLYTREAPIFDSFGITQELEKALHPKVWLKSGGYIVINQTEALVAIDVNTGKYVGKSNRLEDTIVKTNTEAVKEIVRQVRLRDLGGIIVIDFIDMDERKNRQKVMQALEEAMRADRAPYKILQFNDFGLVAITRKRVKQSLERTLCSPCPHCDGGGYIKSVPTVIGEILTEARKMASSVEGKEVMLRAHPDVAKVLKSNQNKYLEELEEILRRPVLVKSDPLLHHEKFDLA